MTITRLKANNQLTIPNEIVKRLHLRPHELFAIDVEENFIKLIPVEMEPRYTSEELEVIDQIVEKEKGRAKIVKPGKKFSKFVKKITK